VSEFSQVVFAMYSIDFSNFAQEYNDLIMQVDYKKCNEQIFDCLVADTGCCFDPMD
jgi:hypothetical protein